ncbi:hypothetical protein GCM10010443_03910 [Actinoplanes cyaneus]
MKPPLTVHNAAIATARVEIKTLTVSGKQVTLAVFRQLREEPLLGYDGTLAGQPWGVVNYHPDKCAALPSHWHVVWQHDADLLRSMVPTQAVHDEFWPEEGDRLITAAVRDIVLHGSTSLFTSELPLFELTREPSGYDRGERAKRGILLQDPSLPVRADLSEAGRRVVSAMRARDRARNYSSGLPEAERNLDICMDSLQAEIAEYGASNNELLDEYRAAIAEEVARRKRHVEARKVIADLPQLFIAV